MNESLDCINKSIDILRLYIEDQDWGYKIDVLLNNKCKIINWMLI